MDILNEELISKLKNSVSRKLNKQDDLIDIRNLYGVFIDSYDRRKNMNTFVICKEIICKQNDLEYPCLQEFFVGQIIDNAMLTLPGWRSTGDFFSTNLNGMCFCLPIVNLLGKHHKDGKVNKKDLAHLYYIVNEYLKKNKEFTSELIRNERMR